MTRSTRVICGLDLLELKSIHNHKGPHLGDIKTISAECSIQKRKLNYLMACT